MPKRTVRPRTEFNKSYAVGSRKSSMTPYSFSATEVRDRHEIGRMMCSIDGKLGPFAVFCEGVPKNARVHLVSKDIEGETVSTYRIPERGTKIGIEVPVESGSMFSIVADYSLCDDKDAVALSIDIGFPYSIEKKEAQDLFKALDINKEKHKDAVQPPQIT